MSTNSVNESSTSSSGVKIAFYVTEQSAGLADAATLMYASLCRRSFSDYLDPFIILRDPDGNVGRLKSIFDGFPIIKCNSDSQLDELILTNKIKFFIVCTTEETCPLLSTIPVGVYYLGGGRPAPFGDVFVGDLPIAQAGTIESFRGKFLTPLLREAKTYGVQLGDKIVAIFTGAKPADAISIIRADYPPTFSKGTQPVPEPVNPLKALRNAIDTAGPKTSKIFMTCSWTPSAQLFKDWAKLCPTRNPGATIVPEAKNADYTLIVNKPFHGDSYNPVKSIVLRMEPYIDKNAAFNDWLVATPKNKFMYFLENGQHLNNVEWWLSKNYDQLLTEGIAMKSDPARAPISTVVSGQYTMEGHKLRIDFIKFFQENSALEMDVYGHANPFGLKNYKGSLPERAKDAGIFPYKYHFAAENSDIPCYITEKFWDAILGECLLFYWGASNAEQYIDPRAFIRLDFKGGFAAAQKTIETAISSDEWSKRIDVIRREKQRILRHYSMVPRVAALVQAKQIPFWYLNYIPGVDVSLPQIPGVNLQMVSPPPLSSDARELPILLRNYSSATIQSLQFLRMLTHYTAWKSCSGSGITCILEPGIAWDNFLDMFTATLAAAAELPEWDIIYLGWLPVNHDVELPKRESGNLLTVVPLWPHVLATSTHSSDKPDMPMVSSGLIGGAYLLHPRGAKKLAEAIEAHGFMLSWDEQALMLQTTINLQSYLTWKNLYAPSVVPTSELMHVFRKFPGEEQFTNTPVPIAFPPRKPAEAIMLMPDRELKAQVAQAQAAQAQAALPEKA